MLYFLHKSSNEFAKSEWASMFADMMTNEKLIQDTSLCIYENDEILVTHDFMSYLDDTKGDFIDVAMLKDSKII